VHQLDLNCFKSETSYCLWIRKCKRTVFWLNRLPCNFEVCAIYLTSRFSLYLEIYFLLSFTNGREAAFWYHAHSMRWLFAIDLSFCVSALYFQRKYWVKTAVIQIYMASLCIAAGHLHTHTRIVVSYNMVQIKIYLCSGILHFGTGCS
jgi:hypothetical protein